MGVRILWAIATGFFLGVFVRSFFTISIIAATSAALLATFALVVPFIDRRFSKYAIIAAFACIAFGIGIFRMDSAELHPDPILAERLDTRVTLAGTVTDEPDRRETNILVPIEVDTLILGSTSQPVHSKVLVSFPVYTQVSYGDLVHVSGILREPQSFATTPGREFDYPHFLAVSGIMYRLTNAYVDSIEGNDGNFIKASAIHIKQLYLRGLSQALPEPEAGLAGGITVGDKRSIGPELHEVFQRVSLVHIIVLSGYNITIVINAIAKLFKWLPRSVDFGISGVVVLFFVLMTGGAASAMRAGAMAMIAMFARVTGRQFIALRALGVFALALVAWNPYHLGFDPSFQLSVLATVGLITLTPIVATRLQWITEKWALREIAASTIGTQIAVLPLLLYQNGLLSIVSLPANLLALIPIPFTMFLSFVAAIAGLTLPSLAVFVGFPAYISLAYIIAVAQTLNALPFSAFVVPAFPAWLMAGVYGAMFVGVFYFNKKRPSVVLGRTADRSK